MTRRWIGPLLVLGALALLGLATVPAASASATVGDLAPTFTLPDIYGHPFNLTSYRNSSVVVIEFTSLSCSECAIVMQSLRSMYASYNATGTSDVRIISIYTEPSFGDTIPALRTYHQENNITWTMAQDTPQLTVQTAYGVTELPDLVIINEKGQATYDKTGGATTPQLESEQLQPAISSALAGKAAPISLVVVSVYALAAIAGLTTFFSPCAFPMFPGYMALFLGLNTNAAAGSPAAEPGGYRGAVKKALSAGSVTALGMLIVFLLLGVALIFAAGLVDTHIPDLLVVVGVVLVALGLLLFTNLQYWRLVAPLQRVWQRIAGGGDAPTPIAGATPTSGRAFYLKLFSYGMGYAAAAAGCVAPVIISAIVAGLALGVVGGVINILIYSLTAALLMIGVTVALALAGKRWVDLLKAYTPVIKKVSAGVLVIVGVYLLYYYYIAWIA